MFCVLAVASKVSKMFSPFFSLTELEPNLFFFFFEELQFIVLQRCPVQDSGNVSLLLLLLLLGGVVEWVTMEQFFFS